MYWMLFAKQSLFRKKTFMLDQMTQWNNSKFAIFLEYEEKVLV